MKKFIIFGALFGFLIAFLSILGISLSVTLPFIIIPRWLMMLFVSPGGKNILFITCLIIASVLWYILLSFALNFIFQKKGKLGVIVAIVVYCFMIAFLGAYRTNMFITEPLTNISNRAGEITSFEECVEAGNLVMESYPRQCRSKEGLFVENIGNEMEKASLIRLDDPRPNQQITSPLKISGQARGTWFFEGSFPVVLTDWDGLIIAEGYAQAQGEWMTEDFVPFSAELNFTMPDYSDKGALMLQKDNPSGLPENDDALEVPVQFLKNQKLKAIDCLPEQRNVDVCIELYEPVCGQVQVECIKAPCYPIKQTFSNSCKACANSRVMSYTEGECLEGGSVKY